MSGSNFTVEDDGPQTLGQRIGAAFGAVRVWAASETGGWIIVGVLGAAVLAAAATLLIVPRLAANENQISGVRTTTPPPSAPAPDLTDFTLAPNEIQDISFEQARVWNAGLPFSQEAIRPAARFIAPTTDIESYGRALDCLTTAIYYEAASETPQGQAAVAQVVLNRARHPAYPRTVCGVVFQGSERTTGCQFSFTCDGAMARVPSPAGWERARSVASAALNGTVSNAVGTATHYHTDWVAPYWAPRLTKLVQIGTHIFYRWNGAWGLPSAFTGVYAGAEPIEPKMIGLTTIEAHLPAEIMDLGPLSPLAPETEAPRLSPRLDLDVALASQDQAPVETAQPAEHLSQASAAPPAQVVQRDVLVMADPLVSPAEPARRRQRIAAPSGW